MEPDLGRPGNRGTDRVRPARPLASMEPDLGRPGNRDNHYGRAKTQKASMEPDLGRPGNIFAHAAMSFQSSCFNGAGPGKARKSAHSRASCKRVSWLQWSRTWEGPEIQSSAVLSYLVGVLQWSRTWEGPETIEATKPFCNSPVNARISGPSQVRLH